MCVCMGKESGSCALAVRVCVCVCEQGVRVGHICVTVPYINRVGQICEYTPYTGMYGRLVCMVDKCVW